MPSDATGSSSRAPDILRYAAFSSEPTGGNPAGVVLEAGGLDEVAMLAVARRVGYSETAFLTPDPAAPGTYRVRYFSPEAEVPFCGHATVAAAVALATRDGAGSVLFRTRSGPVAVRSGPAAAGLFEASLTSVPPSVEGVTAGDLAEALAALGYLQGDLDPALPPRIAYAGARHLILGVASRGRLAALDYAFERLKAFMLARELTTVALVFRERAELFHARNPFPVGGVYEDPATGAAAAALGAYLRDLRLVDAPTRITVLQGADMGRPGRIVVDIPAGSGPITVTGVAVPIEDGS